MFQKNIAHHALSHPLLTHPLIRACAVKTPALIITPPAVLPGVWCLVTLLGDQIRRYHAFSLLHPLSSGPVCSQSIATDVPLAQPPNNVTPPRCHTPAAGLLLCMVNITGVCFHPCYTVRYRPTMNGAYVSRLAG